MEIWLSILNKISLNISSSLAGTWSCCGRTGENCCCQSSSAPINNIAHWKCAEIITNTREGDVLCFAKYLEMLPNIFFFLFSGWLQMVFSWSNRWLSNFICYICIFGFGFHFWVHFMWQAFHVLRTNGVNVQMISQGASKVSLTSLLYLKKLSQILCPFKWCIEISVIFPHILVPIFSSVRHDS